MSRSQGVSRGVQSLLPYTRFNRLRAPQQDLAVVVTLPAPYQRFYREWVGSEHRATPIHWLPALDKWRRDPRTGQLTVIQNEPVPVLFPPQMHQGLWGGEGVIEGTVKKAKYRRPVPRYWVPNFQRSVVYSEVLDKYFSLIVTERALALIDQHSGLDSYLLKTPAYDLKSLLALKLKRKLFFTLMDKDFRQTDTEKQTELFRKYEGYLIPREDAEWYGYSVKEAQVKQAMILKEGTKPVPLKHQLRENHLADLKKAQVDSEAGDQKSIDSTSWTKKLNPFAKPASLS